MPATVNLLWFGNLPQINSNPNTPATETQANNLNGHHAVGPDQIAAVEVTGETRTVNIGGTPTDAFATTYNGQPESTMTYTSPVSGLPVSTEITGFFSVDYTLTFPDGSTANQTGVLMQMDNGDIFFRPALDTVADWDGIDVLRAVTIIDADPLNANTYAATISFSPDIFELPITCFTAGTMILTQTGERPVEDLQAGDMIWTRDNGFQPLRWHGQRSLSARELAANPKLRPIRIAAGALGPNRPERDLTVSPQHRILVRSQIAQRMFCAPELLVAAHQLTEVPGIEQAADMEKLTYVHLLFDRHEVLMSNGAETESLYPGPQAINALGDAAEEIFTLFPQLRDTTLVLAGARPFATGHRARQMARRHVANQRALAS